MIMKALRSPAALAAALAGTLAVGAVAAPASAQSAAAQRAAGAAAPAAPATRYEDVSSDRSFLLQQQGKEAIVKFEDTNEVMVLQAIPAQRGDTFLRNDDGKVMFRLTEQGNLVSYVDNKNGAPVAMLGAANAPLNVPAMARSLNETRSTAAARLTRLAGHDVTIFGAAEFASNEAWASEVLGNVVSGVEKANGPAGRAASSLNAVRLTRGLTASVAFRDGELVLGVNPAAGDAGRPGADAIAAAITAARSTN
jgi:uncharacterized protein DUF4908